HLSVIRIRLSDSRRFLRLLNPRLEISFRHRTNRDRHSAVVLSADLIALAVEHAGHARFHPGLDRPARDGIALHAERRDEEAMDDVRAAGQHAYLFANRDDQLIVDLKKAPLAWLQVLVVDIAALDVEI